MDHKSPPPAGAARIDTHDQLQLEIKLDHPLRGPGAESVRELELWAFFPSSLGVSSAGFDKARFFEDLTAYVRFQTPRRSLPFLLSQDNDSSPMLWLARHEGRLTSGLAEEAEVEKALREVRLMAAVFRSAVRDEVAFLAQHLRGAGRDEHLQAARRFHAESAMVVARFRQLKNHFHESRTPPVLREALRAIDDFMSTQVMEAWFVLLEALVPVAEAEAQAAELRQSISAERQWRVDAGYLTPELEEPERNERFLYRANQLKKYVLGVLHLRLTRDHRREMLQDALFGVAAAVAMAVALAVQLGVAWTVGVPQSPSDSLPTMMTFILAMVGGYILKDRLKDWLKLFFQRRIPAWLHDRGEELLAEDQPLKLGRVEETVRLLRRSEVPEEVSRLRAHEGDTLFAEGAQLEDVLHYRRALHLLPESAARMAPEMGGLNEILRINVRRWLWRMDEPNRVFFRLGPEGRVLRAKAPRSYRVHLVLTLRSASGLFCSHVVVVLNRKGIRRIESLATW